MQRSFRASLVVSAAIALFVALAIIFPRARFLLEIAARELRIFGWLIVIAGVALYFGLRPRRGANNRRT